MLPWEANIEMATLTHLVLFSLATWLFFTKWRKPKQERDLHLMVFPFIYLTGLAYMFISKFQLYFSLTEEGLNVNGLAMGNLIVVILALIVSTTILLLSHPVPKDK
jgi:hypothetical protein